MCGLFAGLLRALAPRPGVMIQQRASYIHGKPPKGNVGPAVSLQNVKFYLTFPSVARKWLKCKALEMFLKTSLLIETWPTGIRVCADCDDTGRARTFRLDTCPLGPL